MNYLEKLQDPRWQRRRLEIFKRDNFTCKHCGDTKKTLNVHHAFYEKGKDPWYYDDHLLVTLCEPCHENVELLRKVIGVQLTDKHFAICYELVANIIQEGFGVEMLFDAAMFFKSKSPDAFAESSVIEKVRAL